MTEDRNSFSDESLRQAREGGWKVWTKAKAWVKTERRAAEDLQEGGRQEPRGSARGGQQGKPWSCIR